MEYINVNGIYTNVEGTIDPNYVMYIKPRLRHVFTPITSLYMEYIKCARQYSEPITS